MNIQGDYNKEDELEKSISKMYASTEDKVLLDHNSRNRLPPNDSSSMMISSETLEDLGTPYKVDSSQAKQIPKETELAQSRIGSHQKTPSFSVVGAKKIANENDLGGIGVGGPKTGKVALMEQYKRK